MPESENTKSETGGLQKRFDAYCRSVIRKRAFKQIGKYIQCSSKFSVVSIDETGDELMAAEDFSAIEKFIFSVRGEEVFIEDEFLAGAIMELQERMRNVLLLNVALEYTLTETAEILGVGYGTAKVYKSMALKELRRKASGENAEDT